MANNPYFDGFIDKIIKAKTPQKVSELLDTACEKCYYAYKCRINKCPVYRNALTRLTVLDFEKTNARRDESITKSEEHAQNG